jgi:hypothetical protein
MEKRLLKRIFFISVPVILCLVVWLIWPREEIDYNTQVKPIINAHCISCHGGVKQNGGFSLLFEEQAKGKTKSGSAAIIPGHPGKSEMIRRLVSDDPEERMPYEKEPLKKEEIRILKKWIKQGAKWDTHWAYIPVQKPEPENKYAKNKELISWKKNDIDDFIFKKAKSNNLEVSEQADLPTLARRISFDLIGLPPPVEAFEKLSNNPSKEEWEIYIQELLSSKHFGEKWAGMWMDLARYSDTKGYERDDSRTIWKYRDWLINAFNNDEPYDKFLTEQIAGDLLQNPSDDQLIATAFHRNTMTNDEGGTDNEEFRVAAVIDRVNTTWEVTMGTTFSCVQCHAHPYDPFKHEDYYRFMAFFNNTRDEDTFDDYPVLRHFEKEDSLKLVELKNWLNKNAEKEQTDEIVKFVKTWQPSINSLTAVDFVNSELSDTKWLVFRNNGSSRLKNVNLDGKNKLIYRYRSFTSGGIWKINLDSLGGPILKEIKVDDTKRNWSFGEIDFKPVSGTHNLFLSYNNPQMKDPQANALLFDWFHFTEDFPGEGIPGYNEAKEKFWELLTAETSRTPVMLENPVEMKRVTKVFERGNWLSPGEVVTTGIPEIMNPLPPDAPANRLGLANWLVSPQNPLTARTYVNRIWEQFFGFGIVETLEDFGSQGIPPTHKELLDHLAWKFMNDFQWSTKKLIKYIVSSATYRQSSHSSKEQLEIDPQNKLYTHGPRIRLTAEQIRDQALVVSGLFSEKIYGPSVMPYQPERIWNSPYSGLKWNQSKDENQYRRAIYTYWKRTSPYPSMELFDMMPREVCTIRRIATNTPLQALVTLNDSVFVEAAAQLAKRMIDDGGAKVPEQIKHGYKLIMYKEITKEKLDILLKLYKDINNSDLVKNVSFQPNNSSDKKHIKAMNIIAGTLLNLDETIMKN